MFTGIIRHVFLIVLEDGNHLTLIATESFIKQLTIGDSVAINGVCLTVTVIGDTYCTFFLSQETLSKTCFISDTMANVELPMKYGDFVGGHFVTGHVHGIAEIVSLDNETLWIDLGHLSRTNIYKASIAVNGVSLTVAEISGSKIRIAIIPETLDKTNLSSCKMVHIEFDSLACPVQDDKYFMNLAIAEGEKGRVTAPPNPWCGCVIVDKNKTIIGKGFHRKAGEPHAEVNAINSSSDVENSIMYVTLEPCCHTGRTPPCTNLIIQKKVSKVVVGIVDPDERVSGKGIQQLRDAGIEVVVMNDPDVAFSLRQYIHHRKTGLPYVTLKIGLSFDHCYRSDNSKWITEEPSRKEGHVLRSQCQAIIVGANTAQQDQPSLDVRYGIPVLQQPKRIVIDGSCLIPNDMKGTVMTTNTSKWKDTNTQTVVIESLLDVLKNLGSGVIHCLVEGGYKLHRSFFEQNLANELVIFRNPNLILGESGYPWKVPPGISLKLVENRTIDLNNIMERYLVVSTTQQKKDDKPNFDLIEVAIDTFKRGGFVLVMDDENRENEGDLIIAASKMTTGHMTELLNQSTGIICVPMEKSRANKLNLPPMVHKNTDNLQTAFTVSVDSKDCGTGVSSEDRLKTIKTLCEDNPNDLRRPGHVFPLIAHHGGLQARRGHTEAAIALCQLADIYPRVAVIAELQNKDGTMKRFPECYRYAKINNIPIISINQLAKESFDNVPLLSECQLYSKIGSKPWQVQCYGNSSKPHRVFIYGSLDTEVIPVRIHSECFTGDVFKSLQCDCGEQLECAMNYIVERGSGVIIFPSDHEGRGIGLVHKLHAYKLQKEQHLDTFEANDALGFPDDARTYDEVNDILENKLHLKKIELLTNNPNKINSLVVKTTPLRVLNSGHNKRYMETKEDHFTKTNPVILLDNVPKNMTIAIVYSMWHPHYINRILDIFERHLKEYDIRVSKIAVPGCNEIPFKASQIAKEFHGILCVGILIKGDTLHFENVSGAVSNGIMQAQLNTGVPMMNCIFSCLDTNQIEERISGPKSTLEYVAKALIKMLN